MPVWIPESTEKQPEIQLDSWRIIRVKYKKEDDLTDDRLIGVVSDMSGRLSSDIKSFNKDRLEATTRSGRRYKLVGRNTLTSNGEYMLNRIKAIAYSVEDVTHEYFDDDVNDESS